MSELKYIYDVPSGESCEHCNHLTDSVLISWQWEDVQELRPNKSMPELFEMLQTVSRSLYERSIELGWEVLEDLLDIHYPKEVNTNGQ